MAKDIKCSVESVLVIFKVRTLQNAYWNGEFMTFGDGGSKMYPLVCLDVTSHEIAHGITAKTSGLE